MHRCALGEAVQNRISSGCKVMRRSLTVTPENDRKILLTKGRFLTGEAPLDIDYTTMVNIFIELGHKVMSTAWSTGDASQNVIIDKNEIVDSFKKHAFNSDLKEEAVGDLVQEIIFKKLVEQTGLAQFDPTKCQTPALPAESPAKGNPKKQKYIS